MALGRELARRGHRVIMLSWPRRPKIEYHAGNPAIWSWPSPRPTRFKDAFFLDQLCRCHRPHCFVANFGSVNVMTLIGVMRKVPVRVCWHHTLTEAIALDAGGTTLKQKAQTVLGSIVLRFATHLAVNSQASATDLQTNFRVPKDKCKVSHLSLADPLSDIGLAMAPRVNARLVCVGRLAGCKGQATLIRAAAWLRANGLAFEVKFVGAGNLAGQLRVLAADLGVADCCEFLGNLSHAEVLAQMLQGIVTVVPSRSEGLGLVCIESLAVGTPVVASSVGGIPEIVRDGVDGFLVPPGATAALAEKLARLLTDCALREQMQRDARDHFLTAFEQQRLIPQQADWFEKLVGNGSCDRTLF